MLLVRFGIVRRASSPPDLTTVTVGAFCRCSKCLYNSRSHERSGYASGVIASVELLWSTPSFSVIFDSYADGTIGTRSGLTLRLVPTSKSPAGSADEALRCVLLLRRHPPDRLYVFHFPGVIHV